MKVKIEFSVDNAAYQTPDGTLCGFRIGETLRKVAWEIENCDEVQSGPAGTIFDDNGNTVGEYALLPSAGEYIKIWSKEQEKKNELQQHKQGRPARSDS